MKTNVNPNTVNSRMGDADMPMDNDLHRLFLDELADIMDAEKQLVKALPKMVETAESGELAEAFEAHLAETEIQVARLDQVFESLGAEPRSKKCKAMQGILKEAEDMIRDLAGTSALDAGLIAAAQKVEHYEIASYGTVCAWAEQMGHGEALEFLHASLDEERAANDRLTEIATSSANQEAEEAAYR